jgi:hypothetical protein
MGDYAVGFDAEAAPVPEPDPVPANDPPTATDDALSVDAATSLVINVASDLLANDSDANGDPLSLSSFTQPANGTLVDNGDGTLTYTPNASFAGADSFARAIGFATDNFAYTLSDGNGGTDTATVAVTVVAPTPVPEPSNGTIGLEDLLIEIWNAKTDVAVATLGNGTILDLELLDLLASGDATIAVTAVAGGDLDGMIGSIRLSIDDDLYKKWERAEPYTLFGDKNGDARGGLVLGEGEHTLELEVFENGGRRQLTLLGDFTIDFEVPSGEIGLGDMVL